ncbi:hypothetical protein ILUMI_25145 [Ignelater luminosus]|uniref:Uncharacterized protein n=1 Tax=Ignelater luminosus TaxID=2038154 RepID=A0A8K0C939_IGNLU|nr:hypothetical protein ILUMI_25145 [Ignelater luminosus]
MSLKRIHYDAAFTQRLIVYAEEHGNRAAAGKFDISEVNIGEMIVHLVRMSLQEILNLKSTSRLNFGKRLKFKESGCPKPQLNLKQRTKDREKVRHNTVTSIPVDSVASSSKRRRTEDPKRQIALEVCDIIMAEIRDRFTFNNHLIVAQLFYTEKFLLYKNAFPDILLNCVKQNYPIINTSKLKSELEVI